MRDDDRRISINQFMFPHTELHELATWCMRDGVSGIGVLRDTVSRLGAARTRTVLDDTGVVPTSLCVFLGLVAAEAPQRRALLDEARRAVDDANTLGAPLVVVAGGPGPGLDLWEARKQFADQFRTLDAYATQVSGRLLLEPLNPAAVHLSAVTGLSHTTAILDECLSSGLLLDLWHAWTDPGLEATIDTQAADLHVVHVSDWPAQPEQIFQRAVPGEGLINLSSLATRLTSGGFSGWWELEVFADPRFPAHDDKRLYAEALQGLRSVLGTADDI